MKINNNTNTQAFGAKNRYIREADKIQRMARQTFPMLSYTYIDTFVKPKSKVCVFQKKLEYLRNKIKTLRNKDSIAEAFTPLFAKAQIAPFENKLKLVEEEKIGNCLECSEAALAALCANGYHNSKLAKAVVNIDFLGKNRETVFSKKALLDHVFVLTDMNNPNIKNKKDMIVVDPWAGFADSISGTKARYKNYFSEQIELRKKAAMNDMSVLERFQYINNGSKEKITIKLKEDKDYKLKPDEIIKLEHHAKFNYPELVISDK